MIDGGRGIASPDPAVDLFPAGARHRRFEVAGVDQRRDQRPALRRPRLVQHDGREVAHLGLDREAEQQRAGWRESPIIIASVSRSRRIWMNSFRSIAQKGQRAIRSAAHATAPSSRTLQLDEDVLERRQRRTGR